MSRTEGATNGPAWAAIMCVPEPERSAFFPRETMQRLSSLCPLRLVEREELETAEGFASVMRGVDVAITSWDFPRLTCERLAAADKLSLVMHSGSSVKFLVSDAFWASGVRISQAGDAMAPAVAEISLAFTFALLRRLPAMDHALHDGTPWDEARNVRRGVEIAGARIGVVGASRTGRSYIAKCLALNADVCVYDPYVAQDDALASRTVSLDALLSMSDVVALHAPSTAETARMLGRRELARVRDGGVIVNTARAALIDMDALYDEAASGRLDVALDVYDVEPLAPQDRWRSLPNVLLTPHLGGATSQSRRRGGEIVVAELDRFFSGLALQHEVRRDDLGRLG